MSAFIVSREHIDVLIRYGLSDPANKLRWFTKDPYDEDFDYHQHVAYLTHETADRAGRILWTENVCSVAYRYPDDSPSSRPGPISDDIDGEAIHYTYRDPGYTLTHTEALSAIQCLDYQSCEHPEWRKSEAYAILEAMKERACLRLATGPGEWDAEELAKRPKSYSLFNF